VTDRHKPIIGITAYAEPSVRWGVWDVPAAVIPLAYVRQVEAAGGRALLVPPSEEGIEETLDVLDGILFSGGSDIDPAEYGHDAHPETSNVRPDRDRGELALLRAALERDLPVLAVCRGSQVLNVARGGDLVQHLPEIGDEKHEHLHKFIGGVFADHEVTIGAETRLGGLLGARAPVKSHHHQGFGRVGEGLVETAWAEDGTLEAVEDPSKRFAVGVLWHPEEGEDAALFQALVEEARQYRQARSRAPRES
jgi:putative glutamine amidotransferase